MAQVRVFKNAHKIAAALLSEDTNILDVEAEKVKARAAANVHTDTGDYARHLEVKKELAPGASTVHDRIVVASDPAAEAIEFGHRTRQGKKHGPVNWVPGQFPMTKAAKG